LAECARSGEAGALAAPASVVSAFGAASAVVSSDMVIDYFQ
jgi:hypothetical protein